MTRLLMLAALLIVGPLNSIAAETHAAQRPAAVGRWLTQSGNFEIDIASCGQALCGTVVRVLANNSMSQPGVEMKPADDKPALGMKILSELAPTGDGEWQGLIYNRENGKTYDCRVSSPAPNQLEIRAYKFLPIFGKTQVWTRVAAQKA
jgi:uncharacterized protein (DUF2147 family)